MFELHFFLKKKTDSRWDFERGGDLFATMFAEFPRLTTRLGLKSQQKRMPRSSGSFQRGLRKTRDRKIHC